MKKKLVGAILAAGMAGALLAGCGSKGTSSDTQAPSNTPGASDTAKATDAETTADAKKSDDVVTLIWYMSLPKVDSDTDKVIAALNDYTEKKIGVKIDYRPMPDPDYLEKMPTYINSGEYYDICFTADWNTNYVGFAQKDAFLDIKDLLPKYAKETQDAIPKDLWKAVTVNGGIYGVPSYKEMGGQGGLYVNSDMAAEYGIDLSKVKTLDDFTSVLKTVAEKSKAANKKVIGITGLTGGYSRLTPYESLAGNIKLPGAAAVPEYSDFFKGQTGIFNQYDTPEYMNYCKTVHAWNKAGYLPGDPINYSTRDDDFRNGTLFSYTILNAPGAAESAEVTYGHKVTFVPLMEPLFQTQSALGGLMSISSTSKHPDKALEFINLLNTDKYVGTLIRHGIEGVNYSNVGDNQIDITMGGKLNSDTNGYADYTYGWQFGTPFNQKWDISYPANIVQLFNDYNKSAISAPHVGFSFDPTPVNTQISAITNVVAQYAPALESGMVDPEQKIPEFLQALKANGSDDLLKEVQNQVDKWSASNAN